MNNRTRVEIADAAKGRINSVNLIGAEFEGFFVLGYAGMRAGIVFQVLAEDYVLGIEIRDRDVVLVRNQTAIVVPLAEAQNRTGHFLLNLAWSPTTLRLFVIDREGERGYEAQTISTFPPQSLRKWAREQALIPTLEYESEAHLYEAVLDQFFKLQQRLKDTNGINGFWDIHYEGQRIIGRSPKRETDIHPTIRLLLDDLEIIKNFQILSEFSTGSGRLDFLITGQIKAEKLEESVSNSNTPIQMIWQAG